MIHKNAEMGNRKDVTVVEFGTGDILIAGIGAEKEKLHGVLFSQDVPKVKSNWNNVENPITSIEEAKNPVVLYFSNPESVDQLITSLNEVKEHFKNN